MKSIKLIPMSLSGCWKKNPPFSAIVMVLVRKADENLGEQ